MRIAKRWQCNGRFVVLVILVSALGACDSDVKPFQQGATGGASTGGGSAGTGGAGGNSTGSKGGTSANIGVCKLYGPLCCCGTGGCPKPVSGCIFDLFSRSNQDVLVSFNQDVLVSFTDADVSWAATEPSPASRIEMHLTAQASTTLFKGLKNYSYNSVFRVTCGGQIVLEGVEAPIITAARFRTSIPVMHVELDSENLVVIRFGAWETAWMGLTLGEDPGDREVLDRPELRGVFCQRGALRALGPANPEDLF